MKSLLPMIIVLGGAYLAIVLLAFVFQDRLLFYPSGVSASVRDRLQPMAVAFDRDGTVLLGWLQRRPDTAGLPLLVYYGGNGEEVSWNIPRFAELPVSGALLVNYRGFGDSGGRPSASALLEDAVFILDDLERQEGIAPDQVVLMGRSLGSGVAVEVASRRPVRGLILVTPFDRLSSVAAHHYPFLPVRWLMRHEMDSLARTPDITAPSLVVLAERDATVPPQFGKRLHAALPAPSALVTIPGADHNDLDGSAAYWSAVEAFLRSVADGNAGTDR